MRPREIALEIQERALALCWEQWAQMGVLASPPAEPEHRAQDPEALLVMTLEVGRADGRLFDEALDWSALNARRLSLRRLRAMCVDDEDAALVSGAARWLEWERPKAGPDPSPPRELFLEGGPVAEPDQAFASAGLIRPRLERTNRSQAPDLMLAVNLSLRLRAILGVGIRAEVMRIMLTLRAGWMTVAPLAVTSGYSKRNVHDALAALAEAGVVKQARAGGGELRYAVDPAGWAALLGREERELPGAVEWGTIFGVLRLVLRWSRAQASGEASEYMQSSEARRLLERIRPDLAYAGIVTDSPRRADEALQALAATVHRALDHCGAPAQP